MAKMTKEQKERLEEQKAKRVFRGLVIALLILAILSIVAFSFI